MTETKYTWTVAIIAQYDNSIATMYNELVESIFTQEENPLVRYVIFLIDQTDDKNLASIKKPDFKTNTLNDIPGEEEREINLYDLVYLRHFLKCYVKKYDIEINEDHKYLLLAWGHGAGWGFFYHEKDNKEFSQIKKFNFKKNQIKNIEKEYQILRILKANLSINDNYIDYNKLSNNAFRKAFEENFIEFKKSSEKNLASPFENFNLNKELREKSADLLTQMHGQTISAQELKNIIKDELVCVNVMLVVNCYMMTFETCLTLKDVVKVLIAPQTTMNFFGYNYKELFKLINNRFECDEKEIAVNAIDNFLAKYQNEKIKEIIESEKLVSPYEISISAIDLSKMKDLNLLINNLVSYIFQYSNFLFSMFNFKVKLIDIIAAARNKCLWLTFEDSGIIDFFHFLDETCQLLTFIELQIYGLKFIYDSLVNFRDSLLISILQPGILFNPDKSQPFLPSANPKSLSIFFPTKGDSDYLIYLKDEFFDSSKDVLPEYKLESDWYSLLKTILFS